MVGQRWAALGTSGRIVTVVSAVVLVALLLPWYGVSVGSLSVSVDGLHSYGLLSALGVVVVAAGVVAQAPWVRSARLVGVVFEAVGAVAFLAAYHAAGSTSALSVSFGPEIGVYVALLASLVGVVAALNERRRAA